MRRYAGALRRLLARKEKVTLVVIHEIALRYIAAAAATGHSPLNDTAFPNAAWTTPMADARSSAPGVRIARHITL